jgi:hypothetical protein
MRGHRLARWSLTLAANVAFRSAKGRSLDSRSFPPRPFAERKATLAYLRQPFD